MSDVLFAIKEVALVLWQIISPLLFAFIVVDVIIWILLTIYCVVSKEIYQLKIDEHTRFFYTCNFGPPIWWKPQRPHYKMHVDGYKIRELSFGWLLVCFSFVLATDVVQSPQPQELSLKGEQ